tara:strand:+ start:624 stop:947 length:324 start_codon:yes stop_codon:yes gene_type:complete
MNIAVDAALVLFALGSLTTAGIMVWYVRKLLVKMTLLTELQKETLGEIEEFSEHLKVVYEMETFYGDETLRALLEHTGNLSDSLQDKVSSVSFIDDILEEEEEANVG